MADIVDLGNDRAEQQLQDILAARQPPAPIIGSTTCLHCGEELSQDPTLRFPRRWCDSGCRDDWQLRNPTRRPAIPREPLLAPTLGATGQFLASNTHPGAHADGHQSYPRRADAKAAEADAALYALRGHR